MEINMPHIDPALVETWLKGWLTARPEINGIVHRYSSGFYINVDRPEQKSRYVFPSIDEHFIATANAITEPFIHLKVCAAAGDVIPYLNNKWAVQPQGYMMICNKEMNVGKRAIPVGYALSSEQNASVFTALITKQHEVVAKGNIVFVDQVAIYDHIETHPDHQRIGLATIIMKSLYDLSLDQGISDGILVATEEGKKLYTTLGWKMYSEYTTAVTKAH